MVYRKKDHVVTRHIVGETLLVPVRNALADLQKLFVVEDVAEFIWQAIDGKSSVDEIRDGMVEQFDVEPHQADRDIDEFIQELKNRDLIEEVVAHGVS